jgi:hypothetical protein
VTRDDLIQAATVAMAEVTNPKSFRALAEQAVDAVEPLIRADEREPILAHARDAVAEVLADLRVKVEALPGMNLSPMNGRTVRLVDLDDVLSLIDGGSDE